MDSNEGWRLLWCVGNGCCFFCFFFLQRRIYEGFQIVEMSVDVVCVIVVANAVCCLLVLVFCLYMWM